MPDLDLILSGHTHSRIQEPIRHGDTYVVSCGEYGKNLGSLSMAQKADGRWQVTDYQLIPITADIPADAETQEVIDRFMDTVDEDYLAQFGYTKDQVLAENDVVFSSLKDLGKVHTEHNLGDIIADAYVYAVENAADYDGVPVDLAVVPSGGPFARHLRPGRYHSGAGVQLLLAGRRRGRRAGLSPTSKSTSPARNCAPPPRSTLPCRIS